MCSSDLEKRPGAPPRGTDPLGSEPDSGTRTASAAHNEGSASDLFTPSYLELSRVPPPDPSDTKHLSVSRSMDTWRCTFIKSLFVFSKEKPADPSALGIALKPLFFCKKKCPKSLCFEEHQEEGRSIPG